jgi:hypothetical protein
LDRSLKQDRNMARKADQLRAAKAIVDQLARYAEAQRGRQVQGQRLELEDLPDAVRAACQFYNDALMIADDGAIGDGVAYLLPPEAGSVYLVVGFDSECCHGAVEIYSPRDQLLAADVFEGAVAGWTDVDTVRRLITGSPLPPGVLKPPAELEWIMYDPTACCSVGGRFFIRPDFSRGGSPASILEDGTIPHECASLAAAQALAAELHARV